MKISFTHAHENTRVGTANAKILRKINYSYGLHPGLRTGFLYRIRTKR